MTIPPGQTTASFDVQTIDDPFVEPDETVIVEIRGGSNISLGSPSSATGTIHSTDVPPPAASLSTPTAVDEGHTLAFPVTLSRAQNVTSTVRLSTKDGTATAGSDYTGRSLETVTIPPGQTTASFDVQTIDDPFVEPDETVIVEIRGGSNISLGSPSSATGTIHSTDVPPPAASLGTPTAVDEGHTLAFPVTLSRAQNVTSTVRLSTKDGTATAGSDYTARSLETVTIPPGQTTASFDVQTTDDDAIEGDESVKVEIRGGSNISLGSPSSATGLIRDPVVAHVGQTLITRPVSGTVRFRLPGEPDWFPLEGPVTLPVGASVDATDGAVTLTFAQPARRTSERRGTVSTTQLVTVSGSEVALSQPRRSGRPELRLTGDALAGCPRPGLATTLEVVSRDPVGLQGRIASATLHHGTVRMTDRCRRAKVAVPAGRAAAWRSGHRRATVRTLRAGDVAVFRRR